MEPVMPSQVQKIVVPMDFSDVSERAAVYAGTLAGALNAALYLVHVLPPGGLAPHSFDRAADAPGSREESYQAARLRLYRIAHELASETLHVTIEVRTGSIAESIAEASVHYGADLVIMGTHGRTGVAHLLAGSVAERVIRLAPCPVLVLRSSGKVHVHRAEPSTRVA
jgi:nucleotide-binding universal stress UspA family protein